MLDNPSYNVLQTLSCMTSNNYFCKSDHSVSDVSAHVPWLLHPHFVIFLRTNIFLIFEVVTP